MRFRRDGFRASGPVRDHVADVVSRAASARRRSRIGASSVSARAIMICLQSRQPIPAVRQPCAVYASSSGVQ